ncbi:MAG: hypothetical protein IPJ28_15655 [Betaproteobacteria bacterium]|nr:hypothetical protein [Betaproteobacteria bacterium]
MGTPLRVPGVSGTFVLDEPGANRLRAYDEARASERFLPASTFKIPHALIGLETGAVVDEHEVFRWDGKPKRSTPGSATTRSPARWRTARCGFSRRSRAAWASPPWASGSTVWTTATGT